METAEQHTSEQEITSPPPARSNREPLELDEEVIRLIARMILDAEQQHEEDHKSN